MRKDPSLKTRLLMLPWLQLAPTFTMQPIMMVSRLQVGSHCGPVFQGILSVMRLGARGYSGTWRPRLVHRLEHDVVARHGEEEVREERAAEARLDQVREGVDRRQGGV